jgi:5-methylcytosine-specific restriction endonuclease McrA
VLEADHVVPLTRGGTDDIGNIQPLCGSCNRKKFVDTIDIRVRVDLLV